jgi:uncharacterized glyoxalase superfamily metalloenzyme YdcJ
MLRHGGAGGRQRRLTVSNLGRLIRAIAGEPAAADILDTLQIDRALLADSPRELAGPGKVSRAAFAMTLNALLFQDLLDRVPSGAAYVADRRRSHQRITFDHGALRTVRFGEGPTGALPAGIGAFARILEPLGYASAGVYPLGKLQMTGHAFAHREFTVTMPQFFISELHVERFSPGFQAAAARVFGANRDPLAHHARAALQAFMEQGNCELETAAAGLREILAAFRRCHDAPSLADYRALLAESAEAAWMATEGCAFNHATDRVADVDAVACEQRALGRPIKDTIEVSRSGTVRQTAFRADPVARTFRTDDGGTALLTVPGSFYEFISRDVIAAADGTRQLDLRFDSMNAQGIFKMTAAA